MLTTLKHVYCNKCGSYLLHAKNGTNDMVTCSERESVVSCSHMVKMVVHFLYLSQLRTLFEKTHLWQHMTPDKCDIADRTEYNKLSSCTACIPEISLICKGMVIWLVPNRRPTLHSLVCLLFCSQE